MAEEKRGSFGQFSPEPSNDFYHSYDYKACFIFKKGIHFCAYNMLKLPSPFGLPRQRVTSYSLGIKKKIKKKQWSFQN